ncbi:hypothetical protein ABW19_dt0202204 [Dactylella cylindrospora]|nr:hypothetical protein ABW19_dt0202204 [Dactylella cylindrospora]
MPRRSHKCRFCSRGYATLGWRNKHEIDKHSAELSQLHQEDGDRLIADSPESVPDNTSLAATPEPSYNRKEIYPDAGRPVQDDPDYAQLLQQPYFPFENIKEYNLARWFIYNKVTKGAIDEYFNTGLADPDIGRYSSGHTLWELLKLMGHELNLDFTEKIHDFHISGLSPSPFLYRDPLKCAAHILRQPAYAEHLVTAPTREYNEDGERIYNEMHTADWWWETQETLPIGATLIPLIFASDTTHLTGYSGDKKAWPVYMTVGNLPSTVRHRPSFHSWILLGLLPTPPKKSNIRSQDKLLITKDIQELLYGLLKPLNDAQRPPEQGTPLVFGDGKIRNCFFRVAGWIADHMEYVELFNIYTNSCPVCEVDGDRLGDYNDRAEPRDYHQYEDIKAKLQIASTSGEREELIEEMRTRRFHGTNIAFCQLLNVQPRLLAKPDLLHGVYLGTLRYVLIWTTEFMKKHKRLSRFDAAWVGLSPYPGFYGFRKPFTQITQWQGKELRMAGRILLGVSVVALSHPTHAERPLFNQALQCIRGYLEFHLLAQYHSHTESTLRYLQYFWKQFHDHLDVFAIFRNSARKKNLAATFQKLRQDAQDEIAAGGEMNASRQNRIQRKLKQLDDEYHERLKILNRFNTPKAHQPVHYPDFVRLFGYLGSWSTDASELAHRYQIKEGYRASNRINFNSQIMAYYQRKLLFRLRDLNIISIAKRSSSDFERMAAAFPMLLQDLKQDQERNDKDTREDFIVDDVRPSNDLTRPTLVLSRSNANHTLNLSSDQEERASDEESLLSDDETANDQGNRNLNEQEFEDSLELFNSNDVRLNEIFPPIVTKALTDAQSPKVNIEKRRLRGPRSNIAIKAWTVHEISIAYELPDLAMKLHKYLEKERNFAIAEGLIPDAYWLHTDDDIAITFTNQMTCTPYNQLEISIPDFADPSADTLHPIRCTGPFSWRGGESRHDFIFYDRGYVYGHLQGHWPARVELLLSTTDSYTNKTHNIAVITELGVHNNGLAHDVHGLVTAFLRQRFAPESDQHRKIISIDKILSAAHLIENSMENTYIINSHIDLRTYNTIYDDRISYDG